MAAKDNKPHQSQPRDISQIVRYLNNTFNTVTYDMEKPSYNTTRGANNTYKMQTEFAYLIHEVMIGAPALLQKHISACNEYIDNIIQSRN